LGLSIAISGGIIAVVLVVMMGIIFVISYQINTESLANTEAFEINNSIRKTDMKIKSVEDAGGNDLLNFTFSNNGSEKFWNYDKFNVIIEYDADIGGIKTKTTEELMFDKDSSFVKPLVVSGNIEFDRVTPFSGNCGASGDECTFSHLVGVPGTDKILIVGISPEGSMGIVDVTFDGQTLMEIRTDSSGSDPKSSLWYLLDPPTAPPRTVSVEFDQSKEVVISAISFRNVHQTIPIDDDNGALGDSDTPSVSLTTTVNDAWIIDTVGTLTGPMTEDPSQVERWDTASGSIVGSGSTNVTTVPGLYSMDWTNVGGGQKWAISAAALTPHTIPGPGSPCNTNAAFGTNDWIIGSITNDILDSQIVNTYEVAKICTKLSNPIFANGDVKITIITDLGHTESKSVIAT